MDQDTIGRYEIKGQLGQGGMATVFRAHDPSFDREVAIKTLPKQFVHNAEFRARFAREAKTIANLEHPAIVPVYDVGEEEDTPYLVMRYMTGGDLTSRIGSDGLTVEETARIIERLAAALDHAHGQGFIHRDLKPANILFDGAGEPYIGDFGIARMIEAGGTLTGSGVIGTPTYMSPEQASGSTLDHRSDIYALGVIIFEMLTGTLPYQSETPMGMAVKHMMEPVPDIRTARSDLPDHMKAVIEKAMAKSPDTRYQTARELAADLNRVAQGEEPLAASEDLAQGMAGTMPMTIPMEHPGTPPSPAGYPPEATTVLRKQEEGGLPGFVIPVGAALGGALLVVVLLFAFGLLGGAGDDVADAAPTSQPTAAATAEPTDVPTATPAVTEAPTEQPSQRLTTALGNVTSLQVMVALGEAALNLEGRDLDDAAFDAQFSVERGTFDDVDTPAVRYEERAGTGVLAIEQPPQALYVRGEDPYGVLNIALPTGIPIDLTLSGGVEPAFVNLADLTISTLTISETTAELRLRLPNAGEMSINLTNTFNTVTVTPSDSGSPDLRITDITINEPYQPVQMALLNMPSYTVGLGEIYNSVTFLLEDGLLARVEGAPVNGALNLPEAFEQVGEGVFAVPGYDEAENRVLITIQSSTGTITVERR